MVVEASAKSSGQSVASPNRAVINSVTLSKPRDARLIVTALLVSHLPVITPLRRDLLGVATPRRVAGNLDFE